MAEGQITLRTRKFLSNKLLERKQMIVDVIHPGVATVSKKDMEEHLAKMYVHQGASGMTMVYRYKVADPQCIILEKFRTHYGGGKSTGFALIYDNVPALKEYAPKYHLVRKGMLDGKRTARKQRKERKNRAKKLHGTEKVKGKKKKKQVEE